MSENYEHPDSDERRFARSVWQGQSLEDELIYAKALKRRGIPATEDALSKVELEATLARLRH